MDVVPDNLEKLLEDLDMDIDAACEFAADFGANTAIEDLSTFEQLKGNRPAIIAALSSKFGFNFGKTRKAPVKRYAIQGTPGTECEGEIQVSVYSTTVPDVYIGKHTHADGAVGWFIRSLDVEE